jgi:hypothetical protein
MSFKRSHGRGGLFDLQQPSRRSRVWMFGLLVVLACGDDAASEEEQGGTYTTRYSASVTDSSSDQPVIGLMVHVLDNQTGKKTGQSAVTDAAGRITLDDVKTDADGKFAVLVQGVAGEAGSMDTFQYNLDPNAQDDILRSVGTGAIALATAAANFEANEEAGPISGAVFTGTGAANRVPAACLTLELEGHEDAPLKTNMPCTADDICIRYFFEQRVPDFGASHTSSANGRFFIANAPAGPQKVNVKANGETIASVRLVVTPRKEGTTGETISVANVYLGEGDSNPAAGSCEN